MKNNGQTTEDNRDSGVLSSPLSFLRSGSFYWDDAGLYSRGSGGDCWSLRSVDVTSSGRMYFHSTYLASSGHEAHGYGNAVRCVSLAPDSICPKGWQLPTYSGDKSFTTLISTSYSMNTCITNCESEQDTGVLSNPLSFLRSGNSGWVDAGLGNRGDRGYYWSLRSHSTTDSNYLRFVNTYLSPQVNTNRGNGFAVRADDKSFANLINTSYSMKNYTQTSESSQDSGVLSNPLASLYSGDYLYSGATLSNRGYSGFLWSLRSESTTNTNGLNFYESSLNLWYGSNRGNGFVVRCKSFNTLINTSYSMNYCTKNCESNQDAGVLSNPLSFLHSGRFEWSSAGLNYRGGDGNYWSMHSDSTTGSYHLLFYDTYLNPRLSYPHGYGFAMCRLIVPATNPSPLSLILAIL